MKRIMQVQAEQMIQSKQAVLQAGQTIAQDVMQ